MEAVVFIILHIFFVTRELGNITRMFPSFSWATFVHVTRLDQSRTSENI